MAAAGVLSYGYLGNDIMLDIQQMDVIIMPTTDGSLEGATQFDSVTCKCGTNPLDYSTYGTCDTSESSPGVPSANSLGLYWNQICAP